MSYILDALVQSERARSDGAAAQRFSLLPVLADDAPPPQHAWQYGLLAGLLLLNAAVLYTRLRPLPQAPVAAAAAALPVVAALPARPPAPATVAPRMETPPLAAPPAPRAAAATRVPAVPAAPAVAARAARPAAMPATAPAHNAPRANPDDMPPEIQKQLPALAVAGYIRDADNNDLVMINDRLLHAGDEVEPGLRLEKIAADGLVFSFKGYRFKR